MMDYVCFVCSNTVHSETDEKTREKYRDVIGINKQRYLKESSVNSELHSLVSRDDVNDQSEEKLIGESSLIATTSDDNAIIFDENSIKDLKRLWADDKLSSESQLCYVCSHVLHKLYLFKAICLNRTLEYPAVLSQKYPLQLQKSDLEIHILCPEKCDEYKQIHSNNAYQYNHSDDSNEYNNTEYVNDSEYCHNDSEYMNNGIEYINSDCQHVNNDKHVDPNVIEQFNYENNDIETYDRNCKDSVLAICNKDFNDKSINYGLKYDGDMIDSKYNEYDTVKNCDDTNEIEIKIDNEILLETVNTGYIDNSKQIDNDNISKNNDCKEEDTKIVKKSKKKSEKGFKRIILSLEKQKAELEANRKDKKYLEAEFKCYNCALSFLFKDTYQAHMMRHEESNGEYQCNTCTLRFATPASLRIHAACHWERYLCRSCGVTLRPRGKRRHCCQQPLEPQSVACHLCGNLLKDANGLQQHLKRVHASKASGRRYACNVCGDSYTRQGALRTHMIKHINRKFHCDQCLGTYSSPYTLNQHKKTHQSNGSMHYCDTCGACYAAKKSLLAHMRNTSNHSTTTYECPICSRVCPNQKSLASHIQSVHSTTKDFTCSLCPARYTNRKSLVRHVSGHTKQKPVKVVICHLCGTNFKDNSKLNRHIREVCKKAKEEQLLEMYD